MKKREKGITLIALVVTIIVLLILAGVTIALVLGQDGIFKKAETAAENTNSSQELEQVRLAVLEARTNYLTGDKTRLLKTEINDSINKIYPGSDVAENEDKSYTITLPNNHKYIVEANGNVNKLAKVPEGLKVGSEVAYKPNGSYLWEAEYCSSNKVETDDVLLESGEGKNFHLSSWKVFDINKTTGEVTLVPSSSTKGQVDLYGAQGYNNAVYLLNEACSKLYGNEAKGIKARSINIEDIEGKMLPEKLEEAYNQSEHGKQTTVDTTKKNYPSIYEQEKLSVINGNKKETGLDLSEQEKLIGRNDNGVTNGKGYKEAKDSIQPYSTYWITDRNFMRNAFEGDYYNLIMPVGNYWIASRCVEADVYTYFFEVFSTNGGEMDVADMFLGSIENRGFSEKLFPVVSLSSELIEGNETSGFSINL